MQGLTDMTMRSNVSANELINLEEKERMAKMRSRAKHGGEKWHMAMASVVKDVAEETQELETEKVKETETKVKCNECKPDTKRVVTPNVKQHEGHTTGRKKGNRMRFVKSNEARPGDTVKPEGQQPRRHNEETIGQIISSKESPDKSGLRCADCIYGAMGLNRTMVDICCGRKSYIYQHQD